MCTHMYTSIHVHVPMHTHIKFCIHVGCNNHKTCGRELSLPEVQLQELEGETATLELARDGKVYAAWLFGFSWLEGNRVFMFRLQGM